MKTLYLHIGLPKCGSSSLQIFFAQNIQFLKAGGISYPKVFNLTPVISGKYGQGNGYSLAYSLLSSDKKSKTKCIYPEVDLAQILDRRSNCDSLLLSSEWFTELSVGSLEEIKYEAESRGFNVKVFYFYRDVLKWNISEYKQALKMGVVSSFGEYEIKNPLDKVLAFKQVFTTKNVMGLRLGESNDMYVQALKILGIDKDGYKLPNDLANQSLCDYALLLQSVAKSHKMRFDQLSLSMFNQILISLGLDKNKVRLLEPNLLALQEFVSSVSHVLDPKSERENLLSQPVTLSDKLKDESIEESIAFDLLYSAIQEFIKVSKLELTLGYARVFHDFLIINDK